MAPFTPLFINGKSTPASDGGTFEVRNPFSGKVVGTSASATSADCKAAIEAAAKAFETWETTPLSERRAIFLKAAELAKSDKYKTLITESMKEETAAAPSWAFITGWCRLLPSARNCSTGPVEGEWFPSSIVPGGQAIVERRAWGVAFAIAPWNAPVPLTLRAVVTPILCGNTVVLKASEESPRTGLPDGVLNFISTSRETAPQLTAEIIAHSAVRHVNFTGSDRVGRIIAMEAGKHLKPCVLELGGKSPTIILNDANVEEAAKAATFASMLHSGQICMSTERVIVQSGIADKLIAAIKSFAEALKAGDPETDPNVKLGALFAESSAENIISMITAARDAGAEVVLGDVAHNGAVVQPHLVKDVKPGMAIWERETFGPVLIFAVLANSTNYSLAASLWTSNVFDGIKIASRIRASCTSINGSTIHSEPGVGLAGLGGASGYGRFDDYRTHPLGKKYPLIDM
ncbi:Aldehyde/histidinol dehydrogenase [Cyathus striatus]|nr:Aldehyde/histidinol dehydrogenase [Cyathus striatus]